MFSILELVLSPIVWLMESLLILYVSIIPSFGFSIILLSFSFSFLLLPIQIRLRKIEFNISKKIQKIDKELSLIDKNIKGEERFFLLEEIYKNNSYHPIHSIGLGASFFLLLPILISSVLLFTQEEIVKDIQFLIINDLSKPDSLLGSINILPFIMFLITLVDARFRFHGDTKSQIKFLFISFVLFLLVYKLPAALILYWISNNLFSFFLEVYKKFKQWTE